MIVSVYNANGTASWVALLFVFRNIVKCIWVCKTLRMYFLWAFIYLLFLVHVLLFSFYSDYCYSNGNRKAEGIKILRQAQEHNFQKKKKKKINLGQQEKIFVYALRLCDSDYVNTIYMIKSKRITIMKTKAHTNFAYSCIWIFFLPLN